MLREFGSVLFGEILITTSSASSTLEDSLNSSFSFSIGSRLIFINFRISSFSGIGFSFSISSDKCTLKCLLRDSDIGKISCEPASICSPFGLLVSTNSSSNIVSSSQEFGTDSGGSIKFSNSGSGSGSDSDSDSGSIEKNFFFQLKEIAP